MTGRARERHRSAAAALAGVWLLSAEVAQAAPGQIPTECGSPVEFDRELQRRLGPAFSLGAVEEVSIAPVARGFRLRVQVSGEQRELEDVDCLSLFRAALVVAVAMLRPEDERQAKPTGGVSGGDDKPAESSASSPGLSRWTLGLGVGANFETLPSAVVALELEAKLLWPRAGIALAGRYLAPGQTLDGAKRGVEVQALGAGFAAIWRPSTLWETRAGFAVQRLLGQGLGGPSPRSGAAWAGGPTLGLGFLPVRSTRFWAGLGAEAQLNLLRGRFEILDYHEVFRVPGVGGSVFLRTGLVW